MTEESRRQRFLIVEDDAKYAKWLEHAVTSGYPHDSVVLMDMASFTRVRTAMTVRDYDIVILDLTFDEIPEEQTADGFDWIRRLRAQPGFPEMIVLAEGGSELTAVRSLRLGAADYLPKRLVNTARLQRSIKITLRVIEKEAARRAERARNATGASPAPPVVAAEAPGEKPAAKTRVPDPARVAEQAAKIEALANASMRGSAESADSRSLGGSHTLTRDNAARTIAGSRTLADAARTLAAAETSLPAAAKSLPAVTKAPPAALEQSQPKPLAEQAREHIATRAGAAITRAAKAATTKDPANESMRGVIPPPTTVNVPVPTNPKEAKPVAPPQHHIPSYTILQKIGESEAAAVYLALAEDLGHNVALKISKRNHKGGDPNDTGARQIMFQREFEAIAALEHPSIIQLHDYGIHEGVEYLAMEYFPCGDLKARLQNPLTADEALEFLKQIAVSMRIVHEAGIIHRDLKPPNVMLRDDGSVVLIDFGLARSLLTGEGSTRTGVLRGSPYYMSPEQAQGEVLDVRTDLYSLGVILYEMLAGKKPYLGASAIDVLQQHVMAPVPELPVHHLAYQPLLERLMAKSREQRIASCDELLAALESMAQAARDEDLVNPEALVSAGIAS
jgi:ActR/RegA family two-component response regulator